MANTELFAWVTLITTILTPFAVLWLGIAGAGRRAIITKIDQQIKDLQTQLEKGQRECREDIHAILKQMSEYPRRAEVDQDIRDIRQEIRNGRSQKVP